MTPSFEAYTLSELREAEMTIDRAAYPERVVEIQRLIEERESELARGGFVQSGERRKPGRRLVTIRRLTGKTVLAISFVGYASGVMFLILLMGLAGAFGFDFVEWNGQIVYGWEAIKTTAKILPFAVALAGLSAALLTYIGLRVFAFFSPFEIEVVELDADHES